VCRYVPEPGFLTVSVHVYLAISITAVRSEERRGRRADQVGVPNAGVYLLLLMAALFLAHPIRYRRLL
jgi:hypothetical protein